MALHSITLAWKIPCMEEPDRLQSMGSRRVRHDWATSLSCIGEGNGNPLQCSCLENPRDEGAWWAAIYGVAQSQIWLKWLSSSSSSNSVNALHMDSHLFPLLFSKTLLIVRSYINLVDHSGAITLLILTPCYNSVSCLLVKSSWLFCPFIFIYTSKGSPLG